MFCFSPIPAATTSDQCIYWLGSTIDDDENNDDYRYYNDCNTDEYDDKNYHVNGNDTTSSFEDTSNTTEHCKTYNILIEIVGAMGLKSTIQQQQQQQQQPQHSNIQTNLFTNQSSLKSNNNIDTEKDSTTPLQVQESSLSSSWLSSSSSMLLDTLHSYSTSVTNLNYFTNSNNNSIINSYCIVKWNGTIIHQTSTIKNDMNPIWTVQTKSFCIVSIPVESCTSTSSSTNNDLTIEIYTSNKSSLSLLGIVTIQGHELWNNCTGERIEYPIVSLSTTTTSNTIYQQSTNMNSHETTNTTTNDIPLTPTSHTSSKSFQYPNVDYSATYTTFNTTSNIRDNVKGQVMTPTTTTSDYSNNSPSHHNTSLFAMRFRVATDNDINFMKQLNNSTRNSNTSSQYFTNSDGLLSSTYTSTKQKHNVLDNDNDNDNDINALITATDINFTAVNFRSIQDTMKSSCKIVTTGGSDNNTVPVQQKLYRVKPGPDPKQNYITSGKNNTNNPTEWMTKEQIQKECMKQSTTCISVNDGQCGTVFIEILQCTNLPNLDSSSLTNIAGTTDKNDTFVSIICEESMVRSTIIWDSNNPVWMPWTTRSYAFNIHHPSSLLFIGVFDYDSTIIDYHDPVGRIVINIANFEPNISYILQYNLQHDIRIMNKNKRNNSSNNSRGTIKIRLRIEWYNDCASIIRKSCQVPSQRYIINVDNDKSYQVLRYLTRGYIDMDTPSIDTVQLYGKELISFGNSFLYVLDVIVGVLLWRGRVDTSNDNSIWFPIHSIALFITVTSIIEYPSYIVPILLYYLIWILVSINYQTSSRYISKWIRTKSFSDIIYRLFCGWPSKITVQANLDDETTVNEAVKDESRNEMLYELKQRRVGTIVIELLLFLLQVNKIYNKTSDFAIQITTNQQDWLHILNDRFYYFHLPLKLLYTIIHQLKSFCTSRNSVTCLFSIQLFCIATVWLLFPINFILVWLLRIGVWIVFSPFMKIIDTHIFQSWYRTDEELLQLIDIGLSLDDIGFDKPNFDPLLESIVLHRLLHAGRIKAEELYKMKDIREVMFGKYSESIPMKDNSFYPSIPLPQSYGTIYTGPNTTINTSSNDTGMNSKSRSLDVQAAAVSTEEDNTSNNMGCTSYYLPGQSLHGTMIPTQLSEQQSYHNLNTTKFKTRQEVTDTTNTATRDVDNKKQKEKAE